MTSLVGSNRPEFATVQYLRAVAALLVVFYHASRQFVGFSAAMPTTVGNAGVDIFFVVSGFVMAVTAGEKGYPAGRFLVKRVIWIVPLYWSATLVTAALFLLFPRIFRDNLLTWRHLLLSLAFIPHVRPDSYGYGGMSPLVKIGWTLNFEMFFYLTFATLLPIALGRRIVTMAVLFSGLILLKSWTETMFAPLRFWGNDILFEFLMGCIIGFCSRSGYLAQVRPSAAWMMLAAGIATLLALGSYYPNGPRSVLVGLPSAVLLAAAVCLEISGRVRVWSLWRYLGDASYSLYLTHLSVIVVLRTLWVDARMPTEGVWSAILFTSTCFALVVPCAALTYSSYEKPMLNVLRRRLQVWLQGPVSTVKSAAIVSMGIGQTGN